MEKEFNLEKLKNYIKEGKFKEEDRIFCKEYPYLIFIYEDKEFICYYSEGHDLYGDGTLDEIIKGENCTFSLEPFINYPDEMN